MSCLVEQTPDNSGMLHTIKNTFIDLPQESACDRSMAMRRVNSDSAMLRTERQEWSCGSDSEEAEEAPTSAASPSGSPESLQRVPCDAGGKSQPWRDSSTQGAESAADATGREMSSHSTCSTIPNPEMTDASSEEDCDLANQTPTMHWVPVMDDANAGSFVGVVDNSTLFVVDNSAWCTPGSTSSWSGTYCPRPVPKLRGDRTEAEHRAFREARAAADAHQYNLDNGIETVESLFAMPSYAFVYCEVPVPVEVPAGTQEGLEAKELADEADWYCSSCGLLKYDVCGNFCAYCGVKF